MLVALLKHIIFSTHSFSQDREAGRKGPVALFQPLISVSHSPMYECDWNIHKTNSTYFSDLDLSRHSLIACLFREGLIKIVSTPSAVLDPSGVPANGPRLLRLQSVQCSFRREIPPYKAYEMWSRILCWDRKWIYVITHFVKRHAVKPDGYTLNSTPGGMARFFGSRSQTFSKPMTEIKRKEDKKSEPGLTYTGLEMPDEAIYASAISRFVAKSGRLTIHPEAILAASGLLPPKPGGWNIMSDSQPEDKFVDRNTPGKGDCEIVEDIWDWRCVEAENARGLKLAASLDALEGCHMEFTGSKRPALATE